MNGAYDEDHVVHLLRRAGTGVELDPDRVRGIVDTATPTGTVRTLPGLRQFLAHPGRSLTPGRRIRPGGRSRRPVQIFALPIAAALATLLVMVMSNTGVPSSDTIEKVIGKSPATSPSTVPTPSTTSRVAPPMTITSPPTSSASPSVTGGTHPSSGGRSSGTTGGGQGTRASITVTPLRQGGTFTLPQGASVDWFAVESDGSDARSTHGNGSLGPPQVGSGHTLESAPFSLNWVQGAATSSAGGAQTWVLVPGAVRGVPSTVRLPVRLHRVPATVTLFVGTEGGGGTVTVSFNDPAGGTSTARASLPSCGADRCPAVVTIALNSGTQVPGSSEVMVELGADSADARVGLAGAELD